jgi:hypothetical protein
MERNKAQIGLSAADFEDLLDTGKLAWERLPPKGHRARFQWRGKTYVATHSIFRLMVNTPKGLPVACRYD